MKNWNKYNKGYNDCYDDCKLYGWDYAVSWFEINTDTDSGKWTTEYADGYMDALDELLEYQ